MMRMWIVLGFHFVTNVGLGTSFPFVLELFTPPCFTAIFPCVYKTFLEFMSKSSGEFCNDCPNEIVNPRLVVMSEVAMFKDPPAVIELVLYRTTNCTHTVIHRSS